MVSFALPASAAPNTVIGAGDSVAVTDSLAAIDGPGHHFGFSQASVLAQVTGTSITKNVANINGVAQAAGATTGNVAAGQSVTFQVNPVLQSSTGTATIVENFSSNLLFTGGNGCTAGASGRAAAFVAPAGTTVYTCTVNAASPSFAINFTVSSAATAGSQLTNTACVENPVNLGATGTFTTCSTNTLTVSGGTANFNNSTAQTQALATPGFVQAAGGLGCATVVGGSCTETGVVTGSCTVTGSMTCNETTTVPAGAGVGTPIKVLSTTNGFEFIPCSAVALGTTTVTCVGTTVGNVIQGSTVAVCFAGVAACQLGTVTGPGVVNNLLNNRIFLPNQAFFPPPPLEFIPPPPPPLLPPPPPAPTGMMAPRAAFPEVPVIPEADSLFLVVGGLVALGGLVGYRSLRRRRDDDIA